MHSFPRFVGRTVILALGIHCCFSGLLTVAIEQLFPHRMLNVRAFEPEDKNARDDLVASFLNASKRDDRPLIGFFGSSFTWGYPFPQTSPLSIATCDAQPDHRVINVSVLGYGLDGVHELMQIAACQNCRFDTLVVEIPVINEMSHLSVAANPNAWIRQYDEVRNTMTRTTSATHFGWFLRHPSGVRYLALMMEELSLAGAELPIALSQPYDGYFPKRERIHAVRTAYAEKIAATLAAAQKISDRVIAFPTTVFLAGNDRIVYDTEGLRELIDITFDACAAVPGVHAIRPGEHFLQDEKLFCNVTHLNLRGNREFGAWLAAEVKTRNGSSPETTTAATIKPTIERR